MTKMVVIVGFLVAFAAGLMVGTQSQHSSTASSPTTRPAPHRGGGWLVSELNLNAQQQEELNKIWSEMGRDRMREQEERRRQLRRERDEAIVALIRPEEKEKYDGVLSRYQEQTAAMDREMRSSFQDSVERTKQFLTPEQRTKYDELLARHQADRGPGPDRGGDRGDRGPRDWGRDRQTTRKTDAGATSRPAMEH